MPNVGFRIFPRVAPVDRRRIDSLGGIPVANICDNMGRIYGVHKDIKPYNRVPLLGPALTVKAPPGDNLMFHKALAMAEPGDIVVVDGEGCTDHSLCGEIMMREAVKRGIAGFLIDGSIRDVEALENLPLAVYARGVQPKGPYKNGPGEINVPVCIGGQAILPGDIVAGDADGVVVIRPADLDDVAEKARKHHAMEDGKFKKIAEGTLNKSWVDEALTKQGCEIL